MTYIIQLQQNKNIPVQHNKKPAVYFSLSSLKLKNATLEPTACKKFTKYSNDVHDMHLEEFQCTWYIVQ